MILAWPLRKDDTHKFENLKTTRPAVAAQAAPAMAPHIYIYIYMYTHLYIYGI